MRPRVLAFLIAGTLIAVATIGAVAYQSGLQTVEQAPDFHLTSTGYENGTEGEPVAFSLADYRNQTVLLDFMAVACTSCRIVTEHVLRPLHQEFGADAFVILSIDTWADPASGGFGWPGETRDELVRLQKEEEVPWRHALDTDDVYLKYQAKSLPKLVVVGPEGQIVEEWTGSPPLGKVRAAVLAAMEGDAPAGTVWRAPAWSVPGTPGLLATTALLAGMASFFAPCSVGLVPAYLGVLLRGAAKAPPAARALLTIRAGALAGAGMAAVYVVIAASLWLLQRAGHGEAVRAALPRLTVLMAVLLIVLGVLMLFQVGWGWLARRLEGRVDGRRGFASFGAAYGLAAFGCTGPLFLPVLLKGFAHGAATGLMVLVVYTGTLAVCLSLAAALVAGGHLSGLRGVLSKTAWISRATAVLFVVAGLLLLWTDRQAGII